MVEITEQPDMKKNILPLNVNAILKNIIGQKPSIESTYSQDGLAARLKLKDDEVTLTRRLEGITDVSDSSEKGHLRNDVESWELKKYPWWKEIVGKLEEAGIEINVLPTSFFQAALDSGLKPEEIINLDQIIIGLQSNPLEFIKKLNLIKGTVIEKSKIIFKDNPDFSFVYLADQWRLKPITPSAKQSLFENNDTYQRVFPMVKQLNTELITAISNK